MYSAYMEFMMAGTRRGLGKRGEDIAAAYLVQQGYTIRERNYHVPSLGEIDIVAEEDGQLVFVEVRTRRSHNYGTPEESITVAKKMRLVQLAMSYRQAHTDMPLPINERIDIVAIELTPAGRVFRIDVIKNAIGL